MSFTKLLFPVFVLFCFFAAKAFPQDNMTPPKPLENKVYESMVGEWTGENTMMGMKMIDNASVRWAMNHQYIIMEYKSVSKDNPAVSYSGMGIFGVDEKGNAKTWWFDDWGATAMATGSGTFGDNKVDMTDGNTMFKETRTFAVDGNVMTMNAKGSMTMNGQETPFSETSIFKKK